MKILLTDSDGDKCVVESSEIKIIHRYKNEDDEIKDVSKITFIDTNWTLVKETPEEIYKIIMEHPCNHRPSNKNSFDFNPPTYC